MAKKGLQWEVRQKPQGPIYAEDIRLYTQVTLKSGIPQRGKHYKTTCDKTGSNMSKLPGAQEELIDSSVSVEDVHTNTKIVSNQIRYGDNNVIDQAQNMNGHIKLPKSNCAMKFSKWKTCLSCLG